jgi:alkylation response protein AidB-like acyl-CoA dehydrogenase
MPMLFKDTPEEAVWREEIRSFVQEYIPSAADWREYSAEGVGGDDEHPDTRARPGGLGFKKPDGPVGRWANALIQRGWIAAAWPKEYGGAGLSVMQQFIMNQEFAEAGVPGLWNGNGTTWTGPTIITHGTEEQKREHLPKILSCDTLWAQGFSEPGAGSDLASLVTRAVRDGDDYVINGQKIWTTNGHRANWMILMARTNPDAPKHRGITYFLLDMTAPGVTVQPLQQMTGAAGFNQVFFDDVRVPARNVVGEVDRGWYVGMTTLDFERSGVGGAVGARKTVDNLIALAKSEHRGALALDRNPRLRLELADRLIEANVLMTFSYQIARMQSAGMIPNKEASLSKLFGSELSQRIAQTALKVMGLYGLSYDEKLSYLPAAGRYARQYVGSVSSTIGGGTSEIQRNIIAQRGLGLPRD